MATRNRGKLAEVRRILGSGFTLVSLDDVGVTELPESGVTYEDNARTKADSACAWSGLPALADDSGIEVLALHGWPGPESARWMGETASDRDRLLGLLDEVQRRCPDDPRVRYVAAVALARPGSATVVHRGTSGGALVPPRGDAGFGYDPSFLSDDLGVRFGEADAVAKDRVSHRGRALRALLASGVLDDLAAAPGD